MARIQYQGAARASGYRPQQVDERGLARLRQEGERRLQGMRAVADAEIEERRRMLQAMKEDEAYTKGAMDRDYRIATGNQQRAAESLQAQARRDRDQFNIDEKARTQALSSIKNFSDTAKKEVDKVYERARTQNFLDEVANGMSEESLFGKAVAQKLLAETSTQLSNARQIAGANGADQVELARLRANDDAMATDFTEGQIAAYLRWDYVDDRNAYLARKAKEKGTALTPEEEQRYTGEFRQQVIQLMGQQSGFASKLITPYIQQYADAADTTLFAETRRRQKNIDDDRLFNMAAANITNADKANIQRVMHTSFNLMVEAKGYTVALNHLQKLFEAIDPETGKPLLDKADLANFTFIDENGKETTFEKKFGNNRYADVIRNLDKAQVQWNKDKDAAEAVQRQEWVETEIAKLGDSFTDAQVEELTQKFNDQFGAQYTSQQLINLKKRGTIEAKLRTRTLEDIFNKPAWAINQRDVEFAKLYGTAAQAASVKDKFDQNAGIINHKDVQDIIDTGLNTLQGRNSYSDFAKEGSNFPSIYYQQRVEERIGELLAAGSVKGEGGSLIQIDRNDPESRLRAARAAAALAVKEESLKVKNGEDKYRIERTPTGVSYPDIEEFYTKPTKAQQDAHTAYDRSINVMETKVDKIGAAAFVKDLNNLFTPERLQTLMETPNLPPTAYEVATANRLGISQHDLRNLGVKAMGVKDYEFDDVLKVATGVPLSPANQRLWKQGSDTFVRASVKYAMGGEPVYRQGTLFYRGDNIGPTSTGMHTDIKSSDGSRFDLSELDEYVYVEDRDYGRISLTGLRQATGYVGDDFDQHVARGSHGIDVGTHTGDGIYLTNGAVFLENESYDSEHGYVAVIQLPNGKKFEFRHGKKAAPFTPGPAI